MFWKITSTFGGIGYFPIAPATLASAIVAILIFFFINTSAFYYLIILILLLIVGFGVCHKGGEIFGGDNNKIVMDEVVGMCISYVYIEKTWLLFVIGFILFRLFDILKPPPIRSMEKIKGGWGIMLDDVMAGVYTNIVLSIITLLY